MFPCRVASKLLPPTSYGPGLSVHDMLVVFQCLFAYRAGMSLGHLAIDLLYGVSG